MRSQEGFLPMFISSILLLLNTAHAQDLPTDLATLVETVASEGLPVEALESKAREGLAKGVPPTRILGVLDAMHTDLQHADTLLSLPEDAPDRDTTLSAAARALRSNIAEDHLHTLAALPEVVRGDAIHSMVDLTQTGFTQAQSARLVQDAAAARRPEEALSALTTASGALLVQGASHAEVLQRITAELAVGHSGLVALSQGNGNANDGNGNGNGNGAGNANDGNGNGNGAGNGNGNGNGNGAGNGNGNGNGQGN